MVTYYRPSVLGTVCFHILVVGTESLLAPKRFKHVCYGDNYQFDSDRLLGRDVSA